VPESNLQIRLDPLNPGQFFACCGLFELLNQQEPGLLSHFVVDPRRPRVASTGHQLIALAIQVLGQQSISQQSTFSRPHLHRRNK
jgi:CRISPR-associated protein Csb3